MRTENGIQVANYPDCKLSPSGYLKSCLALADYVNNVATSLWTTNPCAHLAGLRTQGVADQILVHRIDDAPRSQKEKDHPLVLHSLLSPLFLTSTKNPKEKDGLTSTTTIPRWNPLRTNWLKLRRSWKMGLNSQLMCCLQQWSRPK